MAILNLPWDTCWCFKTVRAGSIASAIYALVCALLRIVASILEEILVVKERNDYLDGNLTNTETIMEVESSMGYVELVIGLLLLAAGVCLLVGIIKNKAFLLVPFMVLFGIIVVMEVLVCLLTILLVLLIVSLQTMIILGIMLSFLFIDTSCLLCVISHFLNLRAGRESMRAVYRSQGERLSGDYEEGATALPQKGNIPSDPNMHFSAMSDMPVSSFDGEAPPPYRDV